MDEKKKLDEIDVEELEDTELEDAAGGSNTGCDCGCPCDPRDPVERDQIA